MVGEEGLLFFMEGEIISEDCLDLYLVGFRKCLEIGLLIFDQLCCLAIFALKLKLLGNLIAIPFFKHIAIL